MGQASQRKAEDPNYGKFSNKLRGLIISSPMTIQGNMIHTSGTGLDPQDLRASLLFWDRLAWPKNNAIHISNGPDEDFLVTAGVLNTPIFAAAFQGPVGPGLLDIQRKFVDHFERLEPGVWSLGREKTPSK
ncbi:hypothetical protein [Pseudomonas sp. MWU12-2037]|uniref:hypothetical protein n=1 Tax=Pseudomonas sp. MWU12-2037 TaxID=2928690 RepID=UPI002010148F|nr:hypothetical protein [Pseudomonas sp. MWU12-2037]